jgi:hypothetical protein
MSEVLATASAVVAPKNFNYNDSTILQSFSQPKSRAPVGRIASISTYNN